MERSLSEVVERLIRDAVDSATPEAAREAAKATGGLPVQWDMGGVSVLTPLGDILHYDPEAKTITAVTDARWRTATLVKAAQRYRELADLYPQRPSDAHTCKQCDGSGRMFGIADCGVCMGTGWLAPGTGNLND